MVDPFNFTSSATIFSVEQYLSMRNKVVKISSNPLVQSLMILKLTKVDHYSHFYYFYGYASELFALLNDNAVKYQLEYNYDDNYPKNTETLVERLNELRPLLSKLGLDIDLGKVIPDIEYNRDTNLTILTSIIKIKKG